MARTCSNPVRHFASCERPPENLDPLARDLIHGVYKLKDRLLLVLDAEKTVDLATGRQA
jgi:chemotaxis signal transduction protein